MLKAYRLLTEGDTSAFRHKVTDALAKGRELYGSPVYGYDAGRGAMRCGHAVVKDAEGDYSLDMKLGPAEPPRLRHSIPG